MLALDLFLPMRRTQGQHMGIDGLDVRYPLLLQKFEQFTCNLAAYKSIVTGAMVIKVAQIEFFRHQIQAESTQIRQKALRNG